MAVVTGVKAGAKPLTGEGDWATVTWALTTADTTGDAHAYYDYADRTVQFVGGATWGAATALLEGSLDGGTTYRPLTDPQGNDISKTADALEAVSEAVPLIRARLSTPGTAAAVTVVLYVRRA